MLKQGGLNHYVELAETRSKILYEFIDSSGGFYSNPVDKKFRSKINVPVRIRPDFHEKTHTYTRLEEKFIKEATALGFLQLRGHKSSPGLRVSMYNAMPVEGVVKLTQFMQKFRNENYQQVVETEGR